MLFFTKTKEKDLRKFINEWNLDQAHWLGLSVNTVELSEGNQNIQLEGQFHKQQHMIQWAQSNHKPPFIKLIKNHKLWKGSKVASEDMQTFSKVMSGVLHLQMLRTREHLISCAQSIPELSPNEQPQIQGEEKALEWVKVSFLVLKKALEKAIKDEDSTVQMMLFSGKNKDDKFRFKLRIYNLDIQLESTQNHLEITVWDKKSEAEFKPGHQVLKSPLYKLINPIIDEIIKILPLTETLAKAKVIQS